METFLEILKFTIPSLITFGVAYFILSKFMENEQMKRRYDLKRDTKDMLTPLRLQAYERLVLYLERITPVNLIPRIHKRGMSAKMIQQEMIKVIRAEYEHNLAQQIYVSATAWTLVSQSKEEVVNMIKLTASRMKETDDAVVFTKAMYALIQQMHGSPTQKALQALKQEVFKQL